MREDEEDEGEEVSQFEAYRERSETEELSFFSHLSFSSQLTRRLWKSMQLYLMVIVHQL